MRLHSSDAEGKTMKALYSQNAVPTVIAFHFEEHKDGPSDESQSGEVGPNNKAQGFLYRPECTY